MEETGVASLAALYEKGGDLGFIFTNWTKSTRNVGGFAAINDRIACSPKIERSATHGIAHERQALIATIDEGQCKFRIDLGEGARAISGYTIEQVGTMATGR